MSRKRATVAPPRRFWRLGSHCISQKHVGQASDSRLLATCLSSGRSWEHWPPVSAPQESRSGAESAPRDSRPRAGWYSAFFPLQGACCPGPLQTFWPSPVGLRRLWDHPQPGTRTRTQLKQVSACFESNSESEVPSEDLFVPARRVLREGAELRRWVDLVQIAALVSTFKAAGCRDAEKP